MTEKTPRPTIVDKVTNSDDLPIHIDKVDKIFDGDWMSARAVHYRPKHAMDHHKVWQMAYRQTKPEDGSADGVTIVPIAINRDLSTGKIVKQLMLIKEFRVPLMGYCLGFPAGLVDPNEEHLNCALRELKEETGYTANKMLYRTSGNQPLDPGLSDSSINFFVVEVDLDAPENQNVTQNLETEEIIEVKFVSIDEKLLDSLKVVSDSGVQVEAVVYSFVLGMQFATAI